MLTKLKSLLRTKKAPEAEKTPEVHEHVHENGEQECCGGGQCEHC